MLHEWLIKQKLYQPVVSKPILPKAECILYIRKSKVFFFLLTAFLCCYVRPTLTPSYFFFPIFSYTILKIHLWSLRLHRDLLQVTWKGRKLLTSISCSCRYTNPVDHHLSALCPPWVGDNWVVIIRHYYGYYFHFKKTWRHTVQGHRKKGIFRQMHTSCW